MGDLISRQAAINELMKMRSEHKGDTFHGDLLHWTGMKAMLEDLPPVDPIEYCERCMVEHVDAVEELEVKLAIAQPEIIRCKECVYGEHDEDGWWFCRDLGCRIGNEDGSGFCADAERRSNG